ncbi:cryptochrome/photolyase family protein [Caulobacter rhizosphaerae]|uniref:cryptochrome/photolyase family protein n=1 Tax=Caulobacter rhizosphaerae TaxID=2010972 RepID=UPI0013D51A01|nr:deoxyribodipyrimidine photo-lyase [Caulobacter rhizosphaerae]GGL23181.1 deoxyribodipyrimidine photo-lyase [Caulobacter rhizosphaerae]
MRIDRDGPVIVWLRNDLRLADNPALAAAAATGRLVIPLYIFDESPSVRPMGAASLWWLDKSLTALAASLEAIGSRLILRRGPTREVLEDLIAHAQPAGVVWNRLYDAASIDRDGGLKAWLKDEGIACESFNAGLLNEPWTVKNGAGQPYKVFTPYWRAARDRLHHVQVEPAPNALPAPARWPPTEALESWRLHPTKPDWSTRFDLWTPGEGGAAERLDDFLSSPVQHYDRQRDLPGVEATSRLSPHLHFGEIGPRQVWVAARNAVEAGDAPAGPVETFLSEIGWREFNHSILFHNPDLPKANFRPEFDGFPWMRDDAAFEAWTRGETGYPIVDAGLRELWATGFMHNRVRMIAASFLVKHLLIDWRAGEAWFWDALVDADLANNVGNWQWVAGSGADAAPYFRIFNPIAQGQKFDPVGAYVRRWVPELASLPDALIHEPWKASAQLDPAARRIYGEPIVGHPAARERALAAYRGLKREQISREGR